jgi:pimeloyl-ACP methyl ester carboxylesterase
MMVGDQVLDGATDKHHAPLSEECQSMLRIWQVALELGHVECRPTTTFFDLGGDSVSSIRLVSAIRVAYPGVTFTVKDVFERASLGGMAERLSKLRSTEECNSVEIVSIADTERKPIVYSSLQRANDSNRSLRKVRRSKSKNAVVCFPGLGWMGGEFEPMTNSLVGFSVYIAGLVDPSSSLKSLVKMIHDEIEQLTCDFVVLVGHSMGGLVAKQVFALLGQSEARSVHLVMVDTHTPRTGTAPMTEGDVRVVMAQVLGRVGHQYAPSSKRFMTNAKAMSRWEAKGDLGDSLEYDVMLRVGKRTTKVSDKYPDRTYVVEGADHYSVLQVPYVASVVSVIRMLRDGGECSDDGGTCKKDRRGEE